MYKKFIYFFLTLLLLSPLFCAERTEPLDVYILVDKSLSMEESGAFSSLSEWLANTFIDTTLIKGDTVFLYFFYGETQKAYHKTLQQTSDFSDLKTTLVQEKSDGAFTDIGLALDTLKKDITDYNSAHTSVAFLFTDLIQEASYGSKYAGTYYDFAQRYLIEDRIISHTGTDSSNLWYEITVQIGAIQTIEERAQKIYNSIKTTSIEPLYIAQNRNL